MAQVGVPQVVNLVVNILTLTSEQCRASAAITIPRRGCGRHYMEQRHSRHYPIHDRIHLLPCHLQRIHQDFLIPIHNNLALVTLHDFYMPSYELIISYSVGSDDRDMRRLVLSPVPSSFDSRRTSSEDSYTNDGESSFDDRAEVEASLTADHADDETAASHCV